MINYADNVKQGFYRSGPRTETQDVWHRMAIQESGVSHNLPGRLYVVQCEWCPEAFAAYTKAEAMELFEKHESSMIDGDKR